MGRLIGWKELNGSVALLVAVIPGTILGLLGVPLSSSKLEDVIGKFVVESKYFTLPKFGVH